MRSARFDNFRGSAQVDAQPFWMPVYEGMRVTITRNTDKENGFVNGMGAVVQRMRRSGVQVKTDEGQSAPDPSHCTGVYVVGWALFRPPRLFRYDWDTAPPCTKFKVPRCPASPCGWMFPSCGQALYVALSRVQYDQRLEVRRMHRTPTLPTSSNLTQATRSRNQF